MNDSPAQQAARARADRRKRMQQRQTVIFGSIIAVLLGVALFAGAVWAEIIPAPIELELKTPAPEEAPVATQPCPPEDALPVPFEEITVNVLNSTKTGGLGARTAEDVRGFGVKVETVGNASDLYLGSAKVLVGREYVDAAYTVADLIPSAQIVIDARNEGVVDIVLGSGFTDVRAEDELKLDPDEPIPAPSGCVPLADAEDVADAPEETDGEEGEGPAQEEEE